MVIRHAPIPRKGSGNQQQQDKCDVTEASDSTLWEDVITAEDKRITIRGAVHTLQLSVHDFLKA